MQVAQSVVQIFLYRKHNRLIDILTAAQPGTCEVPGQPHECPREALPATIKRYNIPQWIGWSNGHAVQTALIMVSPMGYGTQQ